MGSGLFWGRESFWEVEGYFGGGKENDHLEDVVVILKGGLFGRCDLVEGERYLIYLNTLFCFTKNLSDNFSINIFYSFLPLCFFLLIILIKSLNTNFCLPFLISPLIAFHTDTSALRS